MEFLDHILHGDLFFRHGETDVCTKWGDRCFFAFVLHSAHQGVQELFYNTHFYELAGVENRYMSQSHDNNYFDIIYEICFLKLASSDTRKYSLQKIMRKL